jgi:hypothetical protein
MFFKFIKTDKDISKVNSIFDKAQLIERLNKIQKYQ